MNVPFTTTPRGKRWILSFSSALTNEMRFLYILHKDKLLFKAIIKSWKRSCKAPIALETMERHRHKLISQGDHSTWMREPKSQWDIESNRWRVSGTCSLVNNIVTLYGNNQNPIPHLLQITPMTSNSIYLINYYYNLCNQEIIES